MWRILAGCWALMVLANVVVAQESSTAVDEREWGNVRGRLVYAGLLSDPALRAYQTDLPVFERLTHKQSAQGVQARVIDRIPNEKLLIDKESRGVKNAIVFVKRTPAKIHPRYTDEPPKPVLLVAHDRRFLPRIFTLRVGQTLKMVSKDKHDIANFNMRSFEYRNFNVSVRKDEAYRWTPAHPPRRVVPFVIQSNVQQLSVAFCVVTDHPYATVTAEDGSYELEGLPVGKHQLMLWHEVTGYVNNGVRITVKPDQTTDVDVQAIPVERLRD